MQCSKQWRLLLITLVTMWMMSVLGQLAQADVKLPAIFTSHMVVQRDQPIRIWGWAAAGEEVTVTFGAAKATAKTDEQGNWKVSLPAVKSDGKTHTIQVQGKNSITLEDVLIGEVWVCSGQSNMQWALKQSYDSDLDMLTANYPEIRLISVPQVGTQEPAKDFKGQWDVCTPQTAGDFSAVGFYFGRQLHKTLNVPIGLIDNAWGGSACEAWIRRDIMEKDGKYSELLAKWDDTAKTYDHAKALAAYEKQLEQWTANAKAAKAAGKPEPQKPRPPQNLLTGNHRPSNIYNGVLKPTIGYGIRGAIWYQGESNASRAYQYRDLFPLMIQSWRDEWAQGDFPFYWVQLADFKVEQEGPEESDWAELREAQTMTMDKLKNVGEAVIIDVGEGRDIHPRNKLTVGKRLARWALAKDYGIPVVAQSPRYKSHEVKGDKIIVTFDHVGGGLYEFDAQRSVGFTIAGEDRNFVFANAKVISANQVEISVEGISKPVAVRYGWANNPVCNLQSKEGLPVTPFRSDDWPGLTVKVVK